MNTLQKAMIQALQANLGIVSKACRAAGVCRASHYKWLKENEEYRQQVEECKNIALDFAESALFKLIAEGNPTATIFALKCLGKARGYSEKTQVDTTLRLSGNPVIEFGDCSKRA